MASFTLTNGYSATQYASQAGYNTGFTSYGSISPTTITENDYDGNFMVGIWWTSGGNVNLQIRGDHARDSVVSLQIGSTTYNEGDATYFSIGNDPLNGDPDFTWWQWTVGQSNPFGTTVGTQISVIITTAASGPAPIPAYGGTIADQTIAYDQTGDLALSVSLNTGADSGEEAFKICTTTYYSTGAVIATTAPYYTSSTISIPAANLPSQGATNTYYLFAYRYASADPPGDENYRLVASFTVERSTSQGSGGGTNPDATYGIQVFDSSSNLTLDISDNVAFFKATGSANISASGNTDISVPGVTTLDYAFTTETFISSTYGGIEGYTLRASIPSNGTVRITSSKIGNPGTLAANYVVISLGDQ